MMPWREIYAWLRRGGRARQCQDAHDAQASALRSKARAERDWVAALERGAEAAGVTEVLRAHNVANRYDDWLREIVRR